MRCRRDVRLKRSRIAAGCEFTRARRRVDAIKMRLMNTCHASAEAPSRNVALITG